MGPSWQGSHGRPTSSNVRIAAERFCNVYVFGGGGGGGWGWCILQHTWPSRLGKNMQKHGSNLRASQEYVGSSQSDQFLFVIGQGELPRELNIA